LQTTHRAQIVALRIEEQVVEKQLRRFQGRWITGTKTTIDFHDGVLRSLSLVSDERITQVRTHIQAIDEQNLEGHHIRFAQSFDSKLGDFLVALHENFAGFSVDNVLRTHLANEVFGVERQVLNTSV